MTLDQLYTSLDSDLSKVLERLQKCTLLERLLKMFLADTTMENLKKAVEAQNASDAFLYVHTLKGVALNLGFSPLAEASSALTELLRGKQAFPADYRAAYDVLCKEFERTVEAVTEYVDGE